MVERSSTRDSRLMEALGRALVAGVLGTAAMTVASIAEAKLSGRGPSTAPAQAAGKVAGVVRRDEAGERRFNMLAHRGYGTMWGLFRGALDVVGLRGPTATLVHLVAVLPTLRVAELTPRYRMKAFGTDALHHAVYAGASGLAYDHL